MRRNVKIERGKTLYHVFFKEDGSVEFICGSAILGKVPRHQGGSRRTVWSGGLWHASDKKPIPKNLQPIVDEAIQQKEVQP